MHEMTQTSGEETSVLDLLLGSSQNVEQKYSIPHIHFLMIFL